MLGRPGPNRSLRATDAHRDPAPRTGERNATAQEIRGPGRESDEDILYEARERFRRVNDWEGDFRSLYVADTRFVNGDEDNLWQWPDDVGPSDGPKLTINKTRQHCLQIINDAKQNKPMVRISPVSDEATKASADIYEGVVRHIEYVSSASVAYDTATMHQVHGGIGWWRIIRTFEDDRSFEMGLRIQRIRDAMSVYMDPDIQEVDGSDARFAFVVDDVPRDEFEDKYPEYRDHLIPQGGTAGPVITGGWLDEDHVRVAEYFRIVEREDRLHRLPDGSTMREGELEGEMLGTLRRMSVQERTISRRQIEWFKIVGGSIVDERDEPGRYIPLVRAIGEEAVIEGRLERKGHVRALKDPQRMYNYWSPLSLDTPLPTPDGWTTMGAVRKGDWLLDEHGKPVRVAGLSPIYINRDCYAVTFDDGSTIVSDGGHKWTVEERGKRCAATWDWKQTTVSTSELTPNKHFIWTTLPLDLPEVHTWADPYVLGAWLGDGHSASGRLTAGAADVEDMRRCIEACGYKLAAPSYYRGKTAADFTVYGLATQLSRLGVLGYKHIPENYLRASREQRIALLQGLMDTDGSIDAKAQCSFTTISPQLAAGFSELLRTLGIKAIQCRRAAKMRQFPSGNTYAVKEAIQFSFTAAVDFPLFRMARKLAGQDHARPMHARRTRRHRIKSVVRVASVPVRCVAIDSESHLFLAGDGMVPTHNSAAVEQVALQTKTPWVAPVEAIEAFQRKWDTANTANHSVLPFNALDDQGRPLPPPTRVEPPQMGQAYIQGMAVAGQELMFASGQYQPTLGQPSPTQETSGKAIALRQRQGDNATYHYIDNLAIAIRFTGRILLDLIPIVYDTARVMQIMAPDGTVDRVQLNPQQPQALMTLDNPNPAQAANAGGITPPSPQQALAASVVRIFNPSVGRYEVQADVGPAYATRRQQAFDAFLQIVTTAPSIMNVAGDLLMKAADFPMAEDLAERLQRLVPPNVLGQGPSPQEQQLQQQLQGSQAHVALLSERLAVAEMRLKAKDERTDIDAYEAVTKRMGQLLSMRGTDGPYNEGEEVRGLILQMVRDAMSQNGMAPISHLSMMNTLQESAAMQSGGQLGQPGPLPGAPGVPPGMPLTPPMVNALSPVRPPNTMPSGGGNLG